MKSVAMWILRYLLIPAGFMWAVGIFNLFSIAFYSDKTEPSLTFSGDELCTLEINLDNFNDYCDSLLEQRKKTIKTTSFYSPYLYFHDLKQLNMFEVKYKDSMAYEPKSRVERKPNIFQLDFRKQEFMLLRDECWRKVDWNEIQKAHSGDATYMNIEDARAYWFPKIAEEERRDSTIIWSRVFYGLFIWMSSVYFKGLPISFLLFLIWRVKFKSEIEDEYWEDKSAKPKFESSFAPLSFLFSLLVWPIIVGRNLRDSWSQHLRKAEILARRKSMLSLISKQDKELYALGREMSLKDFRIYLDNLGLRRRHSFGVALLVVFFISFATKVHSASYMPCEKYTVIQILVDQDVGATYDLVWHSYAVLNQPDTAQKFQKAKNIFASLDIQVLQGFTRLIDGIPKVSNQFTF